MNTSEDCLRLIEKVRATAGDPESAYLIRTRIGRAILGSARLAAKYSGTTGPVLPGYFYLPADSLPEARELAETCNTLYARTRKLCQPSEAFDARWRTMSAQLMADLDRLEEAIRRIRTKGTARE